VILVCRRPWGINPHSECSPRLLRVAFLTNAAEGRPSNLRLRLLRASLRAWSSLQLRTNHRLAGPVLLTQRLASQVTAAGLVEELESAVAEVVRLHEPTPIVGGEVLVVPHDHPVLQTEHDPMTAVDAGRSLDRDTEG